MPSLSTCLTRLLAMCLVLLLTLPAAKGAAIEAHQSVAGQQPEGESSSQDRAAMQTTEPATGTNLSPNALPENPVPAVSQAPDQNGQSDSDKQQTGAKPVGTAAAPNARPLGVAASRPAGAAIAPAKQRRVRTIVISLGVVIGAAVAVGTVAALSNASPSHPH